jgi:hypothetical protein
MAHVCGKGHEQPPWLLLGEMETANLHWDGDPVRDAYSCMRCPLRVDRRGGFVKGQTLEEVKEHIQRE